MKILVLGGTGTVGSAVVKELLTRNDVEVQVLTRNAERAAGLPEGVEVVTGDLLDPHAVRPIFEGADRVFLLNPVSQSETSEGLFSVNNARMAGVERIVYLSVHNVDHAIHLPHFGSKVPVEMAIKASGIPYTILRPNNFYQNDYWFKDVMLQYGVYPQPIGDVGLSRVDVRDIAEAAAVALTTDGHEGETYNLIGPDIHTGQTTAEVWGRELGRTIAYGGNDLEAWEKQSLQYTPGWMVFDFKLMYEFFQKEGLKATDEDIERQTKLLGHAPRSFENFARETAAMWLPK
jgi:uncharacterized protein YbjT (DUF2867 family)